MSRDAAPLNVLDHRFGAGEPLTVGVEEEYMLLDARTLDLVQRAESFRRGEREGAFAELVAPELFESLVEFHTPVCRTIAEVAGELARVRAHAVAAARGQGLLLGSAGTHPFSLFERQQITDRERYRRLVDVLQYAARRELIFGMHVHVAIDDPDRVVRVMDALLPHLAELVALSASSPFWRGRPTGFASVRHLIFAAFPRSGPPPHFDGYDDYAAVVGRLQASGCIEDYTRIWWDIRPQPRFGTVEIRVMDAVSRVDDAVSLTAYVQALVASLVAADEAGPAGGACHPALTHENKWRAARYGLRATLVDPAAGASVPVSALVRRTAATIEPHARALGCERELEGIERILREGNGADRQLAAYEANEDPVAVIRDVVEVTSGGWPRPAVPGR